MTKKRSQKSAKKSGISHPGMMGDGTEEQNLNERGNPAARIKKDEVETAFDEKPASRMSEPAKVTYEVVEHDGGWAYRAKGVFSETFPTYALAHEAAVRAAREQLLGSRLITPTMPGRQRDIQKRDNCVPVCHSGLRHV